MVNLPFSARSCRSPLSLARFPAGCGRGRFVHLRRGSNLLALARSRRHGLRRCEADGDGRRISRNEAHDLHHLCRFAGRITVWPDYRARGVDQAHPPFHPRLPNCRRRAAVDGNPRKWFTAIIKCLSAFSWAAWRCSLFSSAISSCVGMGGSGGKNCWPIRCFCALRWCCSVAGGLLCSPSG